jgi:hypothetical protein
MKIDLTLALTLGITFLHCGQHAFCAPDEMSSIGFSGPLCKLILRFHLKLGLQALIMSTSVLLFSLLQFGYINLQLIPGMMDPSLIHPMQNLDFGIRGIPLIP